MSEDGELNSSELGTKEYWDSAYQLELSNFSSNGDVGDIWFGEESMERVLTWMLQSDEIAQDSSVLDVGCGNGIFLVNLASEGFTKLYGIDYSENAVELARAIAKEKNSKIEYEQVDLLSENIGEGLGGKKYSIVHDKGTYDAISLNPDEPSTKRSMYIKGVHRVTEDTGMFIITSCNWTKEELAQQYDGYFTVFHVIPTPTFMFGGKVGSQVTSIIFKKVEGTT